MTRNDIRELIEHVKAQLEEVEDLPDDVDPERFQAVDGRPLDEGSPAGILDVEDDPLLLYLYRLKFGGLDHSSGKGYVRYEHMVIDEVQDLSVIEDVYKRQTHGLAVLSALVHRRTESTLTPAWRY